MRLARPLLLLLKRPASVLTPRPRPPLPSSFFHYYHHDVRSGRPRHVTVIGGGIVGLSVAREVLHRLNGQVEVTVVEHDTGVALHQTGRNSGVIHAGIYYRPGSLKAILCKQGHSLAMQYCRDHGIPLWQVGKLIVAMDSTELDDLKMVYGRGLENKVEGLRLLTDVDDVKCIEPTVTELLKGAVYSPITAVVNWQTVAKSIAKEIEMHDNTTFLFNHTPIKVSTVSVSSVATATAPLSSSTTNRLELQLQQTNKNTQSRTTTLFTDRIVTCAGVYADRVAHRLGGAWAPRIIPIRGEYMTLRSDIPTSDKPRTNIYPVPPLSSSSSAPPFLGVHFTPRPDNGTILIGPNAIPALARDAYSWSVSNIRPTDMLDMLAYKGTWTLAWKHGQFAVGEIYKSLINRSATIRDAMRFVPCLKESDFVNPTPQTSGIRAQAIDPNGCLIDDFVFESVFDGHVLHVRNAPSPAATSSLAIARMVVDRLQL